MFKFAGELAAIINKQIPDRKEAAVKELHRLEDMLGEALRTDEDMHAAQIRLRMRQLREVYDDI